VQFFVDDRQRRDRAEPDDVAELIGRVGGEVTVEAQYVDGVLGRPEHRSGEHGGADAVQRETERGDDAEVAAPAAQRPEQVGVIVGRRPDNLALGGDQLGLHQVVDGEPVLAHQPADPAAQTETTDPGVAHDAARGGQTERLCLVVDIAPQGTALDQGPALDGIDRDGAHRRKVDHDPVVAHRSPGHVVATASHGDLEVAVPGEPDGRGNIGGAAAPRDQTRSSIDRPVPDGARVVVVRVVGGDHLAPEPGDRHGAQGRHGSSSAGCSHRNIGERRGVVRYLDFAVRNLDFTAVGWRWTLLS